MDDSRHDLFSVAAAKKQQESSRSLEKDGSNVPEFTVSEISGALKKTVEDRFGHVRVRGEISGLKIAASGHVYFSLKDENAVLNAICWKGVAAKLPFTPEEGLEVRATGKLSTYAGRSNYQLIAEWMEPAGEGALMALLEKRKRELQAEGLFKAEHKQALPFLPRVIGVVTSPTGAVIRDILHRLSDRFPCHVILWPVAVQGEGAAGQIAAAIEGFNHLLPTDEIPQPDVLIVARGGGSVEDLWAFNEEVVCRAAFASRIPLISAVGHETDTTLIDYVADKRAPTPTAAAEMAVPVRAELRAYIDEVSLRVNGAMHQRLRREEERLQARAGSLRTPQQVLEHMAQRVDDRGERLNAAMQQKLRLLDDRMARLKVALSPEMLRRSISVHAERLMHRGALPAALITRPIKQKQERLDGLSRMLESLNYKAVLERGFAIVRDEKGMPVTRAQQAQKDMNLEIEWADGRKRMVVDGDGRS